MPTSSLASRRRRRSGPSIAAVAGAAAILVLPTLAAAHTGAAGAHAALSGGYASGFLHPLGGLDHLLAMVSVGLFAALLGGRALWLVPAAFLTMMAAGGALALAGIVVPMAETGIALSVLVLGLAVAFRVDIATIGAAALVGLFAMFHGQAHGAEMPVEASGLAYVIGFLLATALLHGAGMAIGGFVGTASRRIQAPAHRIGGGIVAMTGAGLLTGMV